MDIYERAAYYTSIMKHAQPELSRLERASRVLVVLEMERKAQAVSQRVSESVHQGGVPLGKVGGSSALSKRDSFNALVRQSPNMSTYQLASAIGVSQSTASRWKRKVKHF